MSKAGRFAPSPTAPLHAGNLRTALLAWLFARARGARFLVRVEDLDSGRVRPGIEESQLADLAALGLDWDGPVVRQSERIETYAAAISRLREGGLVYPCYCTRAEIREAVSAPHGPAVEGAYPGTCRELDAQGRAARASAGRPPALRVRADGVRVRFEDRVMGSHEAVVDDFVVRRNDGAPAYNLAVVVDDAAQGVDEIVRGADLLETTGRQLHLGELLGLPAPVHAHVPLVVGPDGTRLAKRHGAITLAQLHRSGYGPGEVRGMLAASVGLAEPGERPSLEVLLARLDPARLPQEPTAVDMPRATGDHTDRVADDEPPGQLRRGP